MTTVHDFLFNFELNVGAEVAINDGLRPNIFKCSYSRKISQYIFDRFGYKSAVYVNKGNSPELYIITERGYSTVENASDIGVYFDKTCIDTLDDLNYAELDDSVNEIETSDCVYERNRKLEQEWKPMFGECMIFWCEDVAVVVKKSHYFVISGYFNVDINKRG
ncbi:hypothetical protein Aeh1ORF163c [Aeromonas phage Aeh1]|uniref:Uncharacterized protein n=1 Tax=Aeromonas phage Aeh1 TaxID=2880362 RepID=Q76YR7_9CAUD|nr:hypothetical protein Aeh1p174 [Aeromonas phage Aeh1]AAQ17829.1 hypothetical protein Aeh1ORF163c [Aeromonas phage Aeh1]